ncbi:hypothetical protein WJX81_006181 [Elliptochloris bilobata]|uniref:DNA polymerase epsilon subunit n=1 Tax=Elliptochloris bilobata TaxID=381761 RepID=A0AAW1R1L3_9CHLO
MPTAKGVLKAVFNQESGITLHKDGLNALADFLAESADAERTAAQLLDAAQRAQVSVLDPAAAAELVAILRGLKRQRADPIQVISAFQVPRVKFDSIRRAFYLAPDRAPLLGLAQDKLDLYMQRLYVLQQRLRRIPMFCGPVYNRMRTSERDFCELTELKALLGSVGEVRYVLGCISQLQDGRFFLEDLSDALPLDLSSANTATGFYTENCVVVAEGELGHNGVFKVHALGFPPVEARAKSQAAAKGLDFFGGTPLRGAEADAAADWEAEHTGARIVALADLWLDRPDTLDALSRVLAGFEEMDEPPSVMLLMGNFQSAACAADAAAVKENFSALAATLSRFLRLLEHTRYVFVPGPGDPGPGDVLPRPPLPAALTGAVRAAVPNAVFATNPCRLRHYTQEIVVFRDDLECRMRRMCLRPPAGGGAARGEMFEHLCATLLQQSHLCPLPLEAQPVVWAHDASLRLYPLPHALVLADSAPSTHCTFEGTVCLNPGSLAAGTFAAYVPGLREVELCDIPGAEDD